MEEYKVEDKEMELEIDLLELFRALMKNIVMIIIVTILFAAVGFGYSKFLITPQYEASVNMIVNTRSEGATNVTNDNITSAKNMVSTYAIIIKSNTVLNEVIENLGLDMKYGELAEKVSVAAVNSTQVMKVVVQDPDPQLAAQIVEQIISIAPDAIVEAVEAGSCKVISDVVAGEYPVSPSVMKYTALFAMVGLVLSAGLVILKELFSNYIEDDADVAKYLGLPVLGVIPEVEDLEA